MAQTNESLLNHEVGVLTKWLVFIIFLMTIGLLGYAMGSRSNSSSTTTVTSTTPTSATTDTTSTTTTTTQDATADWKTYADSTSMYSIKYPTDYAVNNIKEGSVGFGTRKIGNTESGPYPVSIVSTKVVSSADLKGYIDSLVTNKDVSDCSKTTLGGSEAYECMTLGLVSQYTVIGRNNDFTYRIDFESGNNDTLKANKDALSTIQKDMLSSFKFTK